MTPNLTIIVQIVNFLVAYFILERFFFRHAIACIQKRDRHVGRLKRSLSEQKNSIEALRIHVNEQWHRYQRALQRQAPSLAYPRIKLAPELAYEQIGPDYTPRQEEELQHQLSKILIDKVIND